MLVSNDFSMRMVGHLIPQVPGDKSEVYDHTFESVMKKIGQHQVFIDISRCSKLTTLPFRCFQSCKSLLYVDVSYTKLNDLRSLCDHLYDLRALNVSGLEVMDSLYHPIAKLPSLEVLTIRNCNISKIDFIENLSCLRSLDLGSNTVTTDPILHIRNLTRLQELVLDSAKFPIETWGEPVFTWANIDVFNHLSSLKLLNISETALEQFQVQIKQRIDRNILMETESRRWLLFSAIANNDYHSVYRLVTSGCDINGRVHTEDEVAMSKLWRKRCTTPKLRAPFFQCSSVEHGLRPAYLHFAIYFNALECIQILLDCGADVSLPVWFGDIREVEGKLIENATLAQKQTRKVVSARQLVDAVFQRNVHRLTADMIAKKVSGWKAIVTVWYKRLLYVFGAPRGGSWLSAEEIDAKMKSAYVEGSDATATAEEEGAASEAVVLSVVELTEQHGPASTSTAAESAVGATTASPSKPPPSDSNTTTIASSTPALVVERNQADGDTELASSPTTKTPGNGFRKDRIIPPKKRLFEWRDHCIVAKILGKPLILEVKVPISDPTSMNPSIALTKGKKASVRGRESVRLQPGSVSGRDKASSLRPTAAAATGGSSPSTKQYGSMGGSMASFGSTSAGWLGAPEPEPDKDFEIVTLPLLGKESYWLESRNLVVQERERVYEQALLPVLDRKPLDAVERMLLDAAKLRPKPAQDTEKEAELQRLAEEERALQVQVSEESESVPSSRQGTPSCASDSLTPFVLSPPGTADYSPQQRRASTSRESLLRESFSRGGALPLLATAAEDRSLDPSAASTKRLSSSERRDRFFQQLSQRMEDRYLPDS